jgi:hypothetical protein
MKRRVLQATLVVAMACQFGTVTASPRDDVLDGLQKCSGIGDDKARLACYDALVHPAQAALARPPEPQETDHPPTVAEQKSWFGFDLSGLFGSSPSQQTTPQKFGSENLPETQKKEEVAADTVDSISAGVTEYAFTPFGKFIVFLDNGQVWKQLQGDSGQAMFRKSPKDNKVTISRGLIGSYNLSINDSSRIYKVDRVK